ncbi:MAG: tRNA preQ1(34) S-adenosylmethionine ribosyltransferase-isomerase QueA [Candidatus Omnitrophica bacterium]|nr:tRNA preQ1(34) S-adenosylmethionine ribosyltransferase-isomerase QueA [Candidatus Omnitrophota bacterium]
MKLTDFDYSLPKELIAQYPLPERDGSRLLSLDKRTGSIEHQTFKSLSSLLKKGDLLVLNDTKVFNARLIGKREGFEGRVEVLLTEKIEDNLYAMLCKPSRKLKDGTRLIFGDGRLNGKIAGEENGFKLIRFNTNGSLHKELEKIGKVPLPPYIKRDTEEDDRARYQTVYAKNIGAIAAPTAGLHFTDELLLSLKEKGIETAYITLHVGFATFKAVDEEDVTKHKMHKEYYQIEEDVADRVQNAKKEGRRIIAVGTTTCRTLEAFALSQELKGWTDIFIYPGYRFKLTDGLITNFHLPRTTLLMLVSAFSGRENILRAYNEAIDMHYRFYSYGDCMLII